MDVGQIIFMYSRLFLGAIAAFLAIMLWSKTRDIAWMLMLIGIIIAFIDTAYSTLELPGIAVGQSLCIGSVPLAAIMLTVLRMAFIIAAFLVMIVRKYKHTEGK